MMANFLKVETFNKGKHLPTTSGIKLPIIVGITNYLRANAYSNADQDVLWEFLTAAALEDNSLEGLSVKEIMDTWTLQMGYPLITVRRNYDARTARVSQQRFLVGKPQEVGPVQSRLV